jgi:hypothetical protein
MSTVLLHCEHWLAEVHLRHSGEQGFCVCGGIFLNDYSVKLKLIANLKRKIFCIYTIGIHSIVIETVDAQTRRGTSAVLSNTVLAMSHTVLLAARAIISASLAKTINICIPKHARALRSYIAYCSICAVACCA